VARDERVLRVLASVAVFARLGGIVTNALSPEGAQVRVPTLTGDPFHEADRFAAATP